MHDALCARFASMLFLRVPLRDGRELLRTPRSRYILGA